MRFHARLLCVPAVALFTLFAGQVVAQEGGTEPVDCAECHDDVETAFRVTPHGGETFEGHFLTPPQPCEACHRNARAHAEEGDPELLEPFDGPAQHRICLECHQTGLRSPSLGLAAHAGNGIHCGDCHRIHPEGTPPLQLLAQEPGELCVGCHAAQESSFRKPFSHRLGRGGMECFSCHDPHGGTGERSLTVGRLGDGPCLSCHSEKRGPFVFSHVSGVAGDCSSCHQPHGSSNNHQLIRARVEQLCLECHTLFPATTLGSQTPSFHDLRTARFRNCTTCHVAVHGSNTSPALLK